MNLFDDKYLFIYLLRNRIYQFLPHDIKMIELSQKRDVKKTELKMIFWK